MTSRSNLFGSPPSVARKRAAQAEARMRAYEPPPAAERWPAPNELLPTLPGLVHGIVGCDPWVVQCDGCAATETVRVVALTSIFFNTSDADARRLCGGCRLRAGW